MGERVHANEIPGPIHHTFSNDGRSHIAPKTRRNDMRENTVYHGNDNVVRGNIPVATSYFPKRQTTLKPHAFHILADKNCGRSFIHPPHADQAFLSVPKTQSHTMNISA